MWVTFVSSHMLVVALLEQAALGTPAREVTFTGTMYGVHIKGMTTTRRRRWRDAQVWRAVPGHVGQVRLCENATVMYVGYQLPKSCT